MLANKRINKAAEPLIKAGADYHRVMDFIQAIEEEIAKTRLTTAQIDKIAEPFIKEGMQYHRIVPFVRAVEAEIRDCTGGHSGEFCSSSEIAPSMWSPRRSRME